MTPIPVVALCALLFTCISARAQQASVTNDAAITVAGAGSRLVVKCSVQKLPELGPGESVELVVFVMRTNGPDLTKDILEPTFSSSRFRGMFFGKGLSGGSAGFYDEVRSAANGKRIGYRFLRGLVKRGDSRVSVIAVGEHVNRHNAARLGQGECQRFDLDWLGNDALLRTALVVFKPPKTQGGKSDYVKFLTPVITKRVSLKK